MCGIAAVLNHSDPLQRVQAMLSLLCQRGDISDPPEALEGGTAALGTERLRIVDSDGGQQPFTSFDGEWKIVFNGEIYNHRALRREMEAQGIIFHSECDTEVLVNLIALHGPVATERLDGMFAFIAIHRDGQRWIAARDPMGIKPLYFVHEDGSLFFASEVKPLLEVTSKAPVEVFPPATWRTEAVEGRHWTPPIVPPFLDSSLESNTRTLKLLLEEAVAKRLPSDLPCAVLFSGGIDSTLIFHIARQISPNVCGFYVGLPHGRDFEYARLYAKHFNARVEFISYTEAEVFDLIPEVIKTLETFEPNQVRNGIFSYLVSKAVALRGYRVALCGEGADELFCGYPELTFTPSVTSARARQSLILARRGQYLADLHRTQLQRVDRCAMRHALEVRVPFLDRKILEFSLQLPLTQLLDMDNPGLTTNKRILRALYDLYPDIPAVFASREKVVFVDGCGMGNNAPSGPLFDHAIVASRQLGLSLTPTDFDKLNNLEEAWYLHFLRKQLPLSRFPSLKLRPFVNRS